MYRKVASSSLAWLVAPFQVFRRLMKEKFDAYVLWPSTKRVQNWIVDSFTALNFTVTKKDFRVNIILLTFRYLAVRDIGAPSWCVKLEYWWNNSGLDPESNPESLCWLWLWGLFKLQLLLLARIFDVIILIISQWSFDNKWWLDLNFKTPAQAIARRARPSWPARYFSAAAWLAAPCAHASVSRVFHVGSASLASGCRCALSGLGACACFSCAARASCLG